MLLKNTDTFFFVHNTLSGIDRRVLYEAAFPRPVYGDALWHFEPTDVGEMRTHVSPDYHRQQSNRGTVGVVQSQRSVYGSGQRIRNQKSSIKAKTRLPSHARVYPHRLPWSFPVPCSCETL